MDDDLLEHVEHGGSELFGGELVLFAEVGDFKESFSRIIQRDWDSEPLGLFVIEGWFAL